MHGATARTPVPYVRYRLQCTHQKPDVRLLWRCMTALCAYVFHMQCVWVSGRGVRPCALRACASSPHYAPPSALHHVQCLCSQSVGTHEPAIYRKAPRVVSALCVSALHVQRVWAVGTREPAVDRKAPTNCNDHQTDDARERHPSGHGHSGPSGIGVDQHLRVWECGRERS